MKTKSNQQNNPMEDRLNKNHLAMLRDESGISDEAILARGYRTITDEGELTRLGFSPAQARVPGLLLPVHTTDGGNGPNVYRPDNPRVFEQKKKGKLPDGTYPQKIIKYEFPKGVGVRLDCPPPCQPNLADPSISLVITEGQKKGDALVTKGATVIALLGVWNFKGKNPLGGTTFLSDWDHIALDGREVYIVYDSDVSTNQHVRKAMERLAEYLKRKGALVSFIFLPSLADGRKCGVDDWFVAHPDKTLADLLHLAEGPRPEVKPAPPKIELLDHAPDVMERPLALINGRAYAATWCYVQITRKEERRKGEIIRLDPPKVEVAERLFIVRDDGVIFGNGGDRPLEDLGIDIKLPEKLQSKLRLSTPALKAYKAGHRPDPADVFRRIRAVIDRFIDFDRSLAPQETMVAMVACYILATWFLDAFTVAGNLWPNGERGSGKTQLLLVVCQLAYLGQVVLAGGTYATLRDMAHYGATLGFDDAENLSDPRKSDPDKRTLLLAGNRKGNTVSVKEKAGRDGWVTRHINTFSFRLFSAIRLPDNVLASRTIIVPLIRTPDRKRANADPLEYALWPHDKSKLVDDLWCLALANLPKIRAYEAMVNGEARLTGRNLEPWRALLAVAAWLNDCGVTGLWERLEQLSYDYQTERPNLEMGDLTSFVIRGLLIYCANPANYANHANQYVNGASKHWIFSSADLAKVVSKLIDESEAFIDTERRFTQRVGMTLSKLRLTKPSRPGGRGPRLWLITPDELHRHAIAYGIPLPNELQAVHTQ